MFVLAVVRNANDLQLGRSVHSKEQNSNLLVVVILSGVSLGYTVIEDKSSYCTLTEHDLAALLRNTSKEGSTAGGILAFLAI